ncbi:hypothetical protein LINGRAHAP2_LOCUS34870 [Linum grandiflorum]
MAATPSPLSVSPTNALSCSLLIHSQTLTQNQQKNRSLWHLTQFQTLTSLSLLQRCRRTNLTNSHISPEKLRSTFPCYAFKKGKGGGGPAVIQSRDFVDEDVDYDFLDDEDIDDFEDDDDDDDDETLLPYEKMQKRLAKKPQGFGVGKVYDTSIEDKLLDEMQQSQVAQAANVNYLKHNPIKPITKEDDSKKKASEGVPSGIRVQVSNLPKKRNVQRDLRSAFKEFRGIVDIIPAVSGNKKTKDPICKGFAFVDCKSEMDAARFVKQFSGQSIAFGKVQKQIKCRMASASSSRASRDELAGIDMDDSSAAEEEEEEEDSDHENEIIEMQLVDETASLKSVSLPVLSSVDNKKVVNGSSSSSKKKKKKKPKTGTKKSNVGTKPHKLAIPGSAKRLKVREKAVLTDVFSKYSLKAAVASSKEGS